MEENKRREGKEGGGGKEEKERKEKEKKKEEIRKEKEGKEEMGKEEELGRRWGRRRRGRRKKMMMLALDNSPSESMLPVLVARGARGVVSLSRSVLTAVHARLHNMAQLLRVSSVIGIFSTWKSVRGIWKHTIH